jgi:hypothetical protein
MVEGITTASSVPIWVSVVSVLNLLIDCALLALVLYTGWKGFQWLRKWKA